ncbi:MAG: hypothetical protein EOP06_29400 [Proteobacteria bacterium]|nr:MAG: hypothetical protein EOP06_29400 [Pseudomonadota bacterium]
MKMMLMTALFVIAGGQVFAQSTHIKTCTRSGERMPYVFETKTIYQTSPRVGTMVYTGIVSVRISEKSTGAVKLDAKEIPFTYSPPYDEYIKIAGPWADRNQTRSMPKLSLDFGGYSILYFEPRVGQPDQIISTSNQYDLPQCKDEIR